VAANIGIAKNKDMKPPFVWRGKPTLEQIIPILHACRVWPFATGDNSLFGQQARQFGNIARNCV
jgi:hypothetical protein